MNSENLKKIQTVLWEAANNLRGSMDASEYKNIVLPIFFLKNVNDQFEKHKKSLSKEEQTDPIYYHQNKIVFVPEKANWNYIQSIKNSEEIKIKLDTAFQELTKYNEKWLKNVFQKDFFQHDRYRGVNLKKLIQDFSNKLDTNVIPGDAYGQIYEYFLEKFALASGKKSGEFYTPKTVVNLLVELIEPKKGKLYDPCYGSGGMFIHANQVLQKGKKLWFFGQEKNHTTWQLCQMNMLIHHISNDHLGSKPACTFLNDLHKDSANQMDYILANPPFNLKKYWDDSLKEDSRWKYGGIPPKGNANYAWIMHMISKLKKCGTAAFIMANGALTSQSGKKIRQNIIENNWLDAIIVLPNKLFYSTGISATIWIIKKNRQFNKVLFINADKENFGAVNKQIRRLEPKDIQKIKKIYQDFQNGILKNKVNSHCVVNDKDITKKEYTLLPNEYIEFEDEEFANLDLEKEINKEIKNWEKLQDEKKENIKALKKLLNNWEK